MALSSSGLGRHPLKVEITGSNPVRVTYNEINNFVFDTAGIKKKEVRKIDLVCEITDSATEYYSGLS